LLSGFENLVGFTYFNSLLIEHQEYFNGIKYNSGNSMYMPELNFKENEKISVEQISHDTKDTIMEVKSTDIKEHNSTDISKSKITNDVSIEKDIFQTNNLLANIIRNSEQLMNPKLKTETLTLVTNNLSKFFQNHLNKSQEFENKFLELINTKDNNKKITEEEIKQFVSLLNIVSSQAFMQLAYNNIASDSLFTIYNEILEDTDDDILKLIITSTFIFSENYRAIDLIKNLIDDEKFSKNKFLMISLFFKIHHAIKIRDVQSKYKQKLENFLTDIITKLHYNQISAKGSSKKGIIESSKKEISEKIKKSLI